MAFTTSPQTRKWLIVGSVVFLVFLIGFSINLASSHRSQKKITVVKEPDSPLNDVLPIQNSDYQITYSYSPATQKYYYKITLYAIINRPDQYPAYIAKLKQDKIEALQYIKDQHTDPVSLTIQYLPPEATNL